jgi:peptidyl-prolyl cis-trans isomerase B (cyclophilin B)
LPSSREQQLARARAARQAQRRQQRGKHNRLIAAVLVGVLVLAVAGIVIGVAVSGNDSSTAAVSPSSSAVPAATASASTPTASASAPASLAAPGARPVACGGPKDKLVKPNQTFKAEPAITIDSKAKYTMTLNTSCGPIVVSLDAAAAPHAVNLLNFLSADKFFDGTFCHRSTSSASLTVLQCGDPTGTGSGSIGFTISEENTKDAAYTRGTLAMAKTSAPNSTGSQFFLVDKNASLSPDYTVAGHITTGLDVLDKLMAVGNDSSNGIGDGAPVKTIFLNTVTVAKS